MTNATWYHGTSSAAGLETGDAMDPTAGSFEACVWACSTYERALYFAKSCCVVRGGEPIVYRVSLAPSATVATVAEWNEEEIEHLRCQGADAVIIEDGEDGTPELAILTGCAATAEK